MYFLLFRSPKTLNLERGITVPLAFFYKNEACMSFSGIFADI